MILGSIRSDGLNRFDENQGCDEVPGWCSSLITNQFITLIRADIQMTSNDAELVSKA